MEERNDGAFKFGPTTSIDGRGREGLPDLSFSSQHISSRIEPQCRKQVPIVFYSYDNSCKSKRGTRLGEMARKTLLTNGFAYVRSDE